MFGKILKELRESRDMSQEQLAALLGISKSTVGMYEQGKRKPQSDEILKKIASVFSVSIDYLFGYNSEAQSQPTIEDLGMELLTLKDFPMLGNIACGVPIDCIEQNNLYKNGSDSIRADFCLTARGDSMVNANIYDGDIVYIRYQNAVTNGEIAAVIVNEEVTLKRLFYYPEKNQVILQPENPMYEPLIYSGEELNSIRIAGKAVAVTHHL